VQGDLDALRASVPEGLRHPSEVTDEELLESATVTIANLMRRVRSLTEERDALLRRDTTAPTAIAARSSGSVWRKLIPRRSKEKR
jgi:hypothetical protein